MLYFKARRKDPTVSHVLTASERRVMKTLATAMQKVRADTIRNQDRIIDALRHSPANRIPDLITDQPWYDAQAEIEKELLDELVASGQRTGALLPRIQKATLRYRFDAERPDSAAWAMKEAAGLVTEIIDDQRDMIRDYVSRSQMGEFTVVEVARNLRDVVGLTTQQSGWVDNFRNRFISDRMAAGDTFDQAASRAAKATERYQERIHRYRTETIARTEILRASNEGRNQAWRQGVEEGFISPAAQKQWAVEFDACPECLPLDGESVPITDEFPDGDPPLHPNCRCTTNLVDVDVTDFENMTWDEFDTEIDQLLSDNTSEPVPTAVAYGSQPEFDPEFAQGTRNFTDYSSGPEWGKANFAEWQNSNDNRTWLAIREYTKQDDVYDYQVLNGILRKGEYGMNPAADERIDLISAALARGSNTETFIGVRGINTQNMSSEVRAKYDGLQPGSLIHDPGFMSLSLSPTPAIGGSTILRVKVPPGTQGAYVGGISVWGDQEQEYLAQAGTTVRVNKVAKKDGTTYIDCEIVAQTAGSNTPPDNLTKNWRWYNGGMEQREKAKQPPAVSRFDDEGNMIEMGDKFYADVNDLVIINPR